MFYNSYFTIFNKEKDIAYFNNQMPFYSNIFPTQNNPDDENNYPYHNRVHDTPKKLRQLPNESI